MSDSEQQETRPNFDDLSKVTPDMVKAEWRKAMKDAPKFDYDEMREKVRDPKFKVRLPEGPVSFESYHGLFARLVALRSEMVELKLLIEERYSTLSKAIKSMEKIFVGMVTGTVKDKEAVTEGWMIHIRIQEEAMSKLRDMATAILENLDSTSMQLNRQFKAVELGVRSNLMDQTNLAKDWRPEEE